MNHYCFGDMREGLKETFTVEINKETLNAFTIMSGDINPLHICRDYAISKGYKDCVVYGMCVASFYSTLVGVYLPGEKCLFHQCDVSWMKPVYVGDVLFVTGTVKYIDTIYHRVKIKAYIVNQYGENVSRSTLTVGVGE